MAAGYRFSKRIALRYLWSRRSEAFITIITVVAILGIAIGVAVLNITMGIMTGFEYELRRKVVGSAHIIVSSLDQGISNWQELSARLAAVAGVKAVSPYVQQQALISTGGRSRGVLIKGIAAESTAARELQEYLRDPQEIDLLFNDLSAPDEEAGAESEAQLPTLFIGRQLALLLDLYSGETITLLSPQLASSPFGLIPRFRRFVVGGVYRSGMSGYEESLVYSALEPAQQFFRLGEAVSGLEVMVHKMDEAPLVAQELLRHLGGLSSGFYAQDWTELNRDLWEALRLEKQVYFIVLLLIIVMASFSIVTTLIMIVLEKRKDIAVLKTLGAGSFSIATIFTLQGTVIGVLGTVLGLIGGYVGSLALIEYGFPLPQNVFPTDTVPVKLEWINFLLVGTAALVISCLSTIYPAWRASRLEPVEVLRYE